MFLKVIFVIHDAIEGQMTEVKGVRRRTKLLDDLRNRRYWELKEEAEDRISLSIEHKEETQVMVHTSMDLLISSIL